jgi:putative superfamily III holin-X
MNMPKEFTMAIPGSQRSVPDMISDLFAQVTTLFRKEAQLARMEMSENMADVGRGLGLIIGGAVLLIPSLVILLQAGVTAFGDHYGLAPSWSALILGGAVLIVGVILFLIGISRLSLEHITPHRTVHQLQQDAAVAKEKVSRPHDPRRAA